jgi:ribosomal protein L11 methyltransferase
VASELALRYLAEMPYRIDIPDPPSDALDKLVQLGALDIEPVNGGLAAIIPDGVNADAVATALDIASVTVAPAMARDNGSVWLVRPRSVRIGSVLIAPPNTDASPSALRLTDSPAFGTGHHPTTALCIEALEDVLGITVPDSVLDVGTGSGVLALAALMMGVPRAVGIDIDGVALAVAAEHARLNNMADRFELVHGGPDIVNGTWTLVVANVLAAALIEMAPVLIRRVAGGGRVILSGIPWSLESEVRQAYVRLGMRYVRSDSRAGWAVIVVQASW